MIASLLEKCGTALYEKFEAYMQRSMSINPESRTASRDDARVLATANRKSTRGAAG